MLRHYTSFPAALVATQALRAARPAPAAIAPGGNIDVLYYDDVVVCLNKPQHLLSVPGHASTDSLKTRVRACTRFATAEPVHRLDFATSGCMLMGLSPSACSALGRQFAQRTVIKSYSAIVDGVVQGEHGTIALPIRADPEHRPLRLVGGEGELGAKAAHTDWTVVARYAAATRLLLSPKTGRSHQLRVHLAAIGHPILGDRLYALEATALAKSPQRLLLHASELTLAHPVSGAVMTFHAACPF